MNDLYGILERYYTEKGFSVIQNYIIPGIVWRFHLFVKKDKSTYAIEIRRKNDSPPDIFFERVISHVKKIKTKIFVAFEDLPSKEVIRTLKKAGLGTIFFQNNVPSFVYPYVEKKSRKKINNMHQIFVFPSSRERDSSGSYLAERCKIGEIVRELYDLEIPIHVKLVEDDWKTTNFYKTMRESINVSHLFIGVIRGPFSKHLNYEFNRALKLIGQNYCLFLTCEIKGIEDKWRNDCEWKGLLKKIEKRSKHIPYHSLRDFETKVRKFLFVKTKELYSIAKCEYPLDKIK